MGTWGTGIFDNDGASDWIWGFDKKSATAKLPFLLSEIRKGIRYGIGMHEPIAACEGIAWSRGHGRYDSHDKSFARFAASTAPAATEAQAALARQYVKLSLATVGEMGWVTATAENQWTTTLRDLDRRLALPSTRRSRSVPARKKVRRSSRRE